MRRWVRRARAPGRGDTRLRLVSWAVRKEDGNRGLPAGQMEGRLSGHRGPWHRAPTGTSTLSPSSG